MWRRGDGPIIIRRGEEDRRCGRAGFDRSFDSSELVAACPVLHEHVEIGVALRFDDHIAQRLVGGLAAFQLGDTELGRHPVIIQIFALYNPSVGCENREVDTYEAEVGQNERVLEVGERVGRENGWVRFGSRGDHDGVRTSYRTYSTRIFETYTVAIVDNHNVAPEALDKSMIPLGRTSARERGRMLRARQWIVRQLIPVLTTRYES